MTLLAATLFSLLMVVLSFIAHCTGMRLLAERLVDRPTAHPHHRFIKVMVLLFCLHVLEVIIFGCGYSVMEGTTGFGYLRGDHVGNFLDDVYASAVIYSSLGFGDIIPAGPIRVLAGREVLAGLMLIGWSTSFSFLLMQRLWPLHSTKTRG